MEPHLLPSGWYITTRPSGNDLLISPFNPEDGWPNPFITGIFVSRTPRGLFKIEGVDHSRPEDPIEWCMNGSDKSFGFRFFGKNTSLASVIGALLDGNSGAFETVSGFYGGNAFEQFCKNARNRLPNKFRFYKWSDELRHEFTKSWHMHS